MSPINLGFADSFLDEFFAECEEHLTSIRKHVLLLERMDQAGLQGPVLDELLRSFHTLKGLSGMVGLEAAERVAHQTEAYFRLLKKEQALPSADAIRVIVDATHLLEDIVAGHRDQRSAPDIQGTLLALEKLIPQSSSPVASARHLPSDGALSLKDDEARRLNAELARGARLWQASFTPSAELSAQGVNVEWVRERLRAKGNLIAASPRVNAGQISFHFLISTHLPLTFEGWREPAVDVRPYELPPVTQVSKSMPSAMPMSHVTRVDMARLDDVMRHMGQLIVTRSRLGQLVKVLEAVVPVGPWRQLNETSQHIERQIRALRESVVRVRMVPLSDTFARMEFVVRDLVRDGKKQIFLDAIGGDVELDKYVVDRLMDPLLHLVRNAVSHGLETPEQRAACGKPPEGRITLRATTVGDKAVIDIEDDGQGIDVSAVMARAQQMELPAPDVEPDGTALLAILCTPGFSTRHEADRVSGRGIGMDVVRKTIDQLGGRLSLSSEKGKGTQFRLEIPLTLMVVEALMAEVGRHLYAFPLGSVSEAIEIEPTAISHFENNDVIPYRDGILPLLNLSTFAGTRTPPSQRYAVIFDYHDHPLGLLVDRLRGEREVVVHPILDPLAQTAGVAGATQLGDGRIVLILDGPSVIGAMKKKG